MNQKVPISMRELRARAVKIARDERVLHKGGKKVVRDIDITVLIETKTNIEDLEELARKVGLLQEWERLEEELEEE